MKNNNIIKINFKGGIIPPNDLYNILLAASKAGLLFIRFGLRQQVLLDVEIDYLDILTTELNNLGIPYELNDEQHPNIMSSSPAEEVFVNNTWLKENEYKEIFTAFDYSPHLKINISDATQGFTPLFTGNINWVACPAEAHYWHLFIRFPKTNMLYESKNVIHSKDIAAMSARIEETILKEAVKFYDNENASGDELFQLLDTAHIDMKPATAPLELPASHLPYYEGLNKYSDKYWMGIYRRDELFSIKFLKEACLLCIKTGINAICSTPWKTIIIKNIEEASRKDWNYLLDKYQVNIRHAANELNFQVEDNNPVALKLKQYLVKYLNDDDTRSFGLCIGIKTRKKSEVFCSILVKRKPVIRIGNRALFYVYDILCAKDYNPNERTALVYSRDNPRFVLAEQLRRAVLSFYDKSRGVPPFMPDFATEEELADNE
jgi:hypothetical protein